MQLRGRVTTRSPPGRSCRVSTISRRSRSRTSGATREASNINADAASLEHFALPQFRTQQEIHAGCRIESGNALKATNNPVIAMQWTGDTDLKQAKKCLKQREAPMRDAARKLSARPVVGSPASEPLPKPRFKSQRYRNGP